MAQFPATLSQVMGILLPLILLALGCNARGIMKGDLMSTHLVQVQHVLDFSQDVPSPVFGNGTSLFRKNLEGMRRVKRDTCKERSDTEILEYYDLKLHNRCWDDCDCRAGRYCTTHSWCHDIAKSPRQL